MTFQDIFKSSFLENVGSISPFDMVLSMVLSFAIGLFIFWIYKLTFKGVMYSASFGVALITLSMVTTLVILAVTSNVILSLGMVGALSIVRFRAAIKDPLDIVFLFWSIAVGIVLAAGLIPLAVFGSVLIGLILFIFCSRKTADDPYILMLHCTDNEAENKAKEYLDSQVKKSVLKSKSVHKNRIELNYEIRLKDDESAFINFISDIPGVTQAVLVSYNGDYAG